ncbi:MAG: glycosyltransferase family 2 protein [Gammaproteobacteria bacterium]|nr:glycosyltransferase family 2 protein [Gammaproteobacteria bacterium]
MRVSIVTVSFNQGRYLERAIRSVAAQDHDDIEHIMVDAGSRDGSRDIIERFRDRLAAIVLEPDRGAPDGLNKGFALATGEIFAYLNADDEYLPGAVRAAVAAFEQQADAGIVVGHGYIVDADGRPIRRFRSASFSRWRFARGAAVVMQQSTFFRAEAFRATPGFNVANRTSWDAELYLDMCLAGARVHVAEGYWSLFRIHPESISGHGRLRAESARNHRRYFRRVTGRRPRPSDRASFLMARGVRWLADPRGLLERSRDFVRAPVLPP